MDTQDVYQKVHELGVPMVIALTEAVKRSAPAFPSRYAPWIAIFWGIALYVASAYLAGARLDSAALDGVLAGLLASGLVKVSQLLTSREDANPKA